MRGRTRHRGRLSALAIAAAVSFVSSAHAQPFDVESPTPSPPATEGSEQATVARYWQLGRVRWFGVATVELGYAYAKPRFAVGYGRPYWSWVGIEAYPLVSLSGVGHYGGVAAAVPGFSVRGGARYVYPFNRTLLPPKDSYERIDLELERGPRADYLALEAEATATAPVWGGSAFAVLTGYRVGSVTDDHFLFEESLRAVMDPPYIWRARLGYLLSFGTDGAVRVGPAGDYIGLPQREEYVVRAGLLGSVSLDAHLEAQVSLIPVWVSPDSLGLAGGDFGQLGVRLRWATGSTPVRSAPTDLPQPPGAPNRR